MKRSKIIICIILAVFYFVGISHARATIENLSQVEKLFMEAKYERVIAEATRLIDAGSYGREELFYLKGLSQLQLGMFKDARETFRYMVERYPTGKRALDSYIGIGDAYFLEGKIPESITGYNEALTNYPDHKNISTVYYKLGNAYQKIGNNTKAKECFDKVKNSSPLSFESKTAPNIVAQDTSAPVTVPLKEVHPSQPIDAGDYFYVQVGYFKSKGNAEKLSDSLKRKGYDGYISTQTKAGFSFYRVKVGRFKLSAEAEDAAKKLKSDGYKTKVCR